MNCFNLRMGGQKSRQSERAGGLRTHSQRQRLNAAHGQPAIEGRWHRASRLLKNPRTFKYIVAMAGDQRTANDIAVAIDVLGCRVHHKVCTMV